MTKVLLVEDDFDLAERVRDWLSGKGFNVEIAGDGNSALDCITQHDYDVIVLDWALPGMSGVDLCKQFRSSKGQTPILILTAKTELADKTVGFQAGADDYLTKPFALEELSARIRALLRRSPKYSEKVLRFANVELEPEVRKVNVKGQEVKLSPLEFALLECFMRNPGIVFSSDSLLNRVWTADSEASNEALRTHLKNLRSKIMSDEYPCLIQTVHGMGYRLAE